jgi:hypothetical protein
MLLLTFIICCQKEQLINNRELSDCKIRVYNITVPNVIINGKNFGFNSSRSVIDSSESCLNPSVVDSVFKNFKIYKSKRNLMPLVGDGLGYHAILTLKYKNFDYQIYLYRKYYKEGFFYDSQNVLYLIKFSKNGRKIINRLIHSVNDD